MHSVPITQSQARRIWLHAQKLDTPAPFGHGPDATPAAVRHLGYVQIDSVLPLISDQICYRKEGNAWRIAGAIGGVPPGR